MPAHVLVAEHAARVDFLEHAHVVIEARVQRADRGGAQCVCLRPVRLAPVSADDALELAEELAVGNVECVWSTRVQDQRDRYRYSNGRRLLVLHDPDPTHAFAVARAHPDVVRLCEAHLDWEVRAQAIGVCELFVKPLAQHEQALASVLQRDRPFRRELRVLNKQTKARTGANYVNINMR